MILSVKNSKIKGIYRSVSNFCNLNKIKNVNYINKKREKVVILGSGWGGIHFLLNIDFQKYDVTLISPRNYFTFTPLLPCLCSGTLNVDACSENIETLLKKNKISGKYLKLECTDIVYKDKYIKCKDNVNNNEIKINYDYLVISVGAKTNSFNIKGVDKYAFYIKDIIDALKIRTKFISNLEACIKGIKAGAVTNTITNDSSSSISDSSSSIGDSSSSIGDSSSSISDDLAKKMLHIVVVGGGPTGVEVAAELADFVNKDIKNKYKEIYKYISISIIEGGNNLLPTFTQNISKFTEKIFKNKLNINVYTNYHVIEIDENNFYIKSSINKNEEHKKIPYGIIIWASGLAQTPLINNFIKKIPEQENNKNLKVNQYLQIIGIKPNNIYAIGDCKQISPINSHEHVNEIINCLGNSKITSDVLKQKSKELSNIFPQLSDTKWDYNKNKKSEMSIKELQEYLFMIDKNYKSPPPTAQNAKQEAFYLSNIFNNYLYNSNSNGNTIPPFIEKWKGSLAYVGNHQVVAHLPFYEIKGGPFSFTFWKIVYMQMLLTWKSRINFIFSFLRTKIYGRPFI
ncbi:type II NADH:ubiquinone oxidoreductase, putative [Plasmodium yoelii]|uniref:NADH:ubiquinone reductase (non-electrogenic) n=3 Tax=Plasmodium yoelii TaxID=5861 RepID=A0AAF0B439_PLAYO|nr:type II NADH:ubiquinone oxidoreductase, putative [Plasmodium yoelii]WBY56714.1 type II NADH:ubiquinone oxidoreductase [Plasmodium yoelii yoelii]CDU17552.1 type II NADH:ubiquinone oxidoreductase [Plasmodium yoelii]VTZ77382.1 type II NADH:ubiquinone oxidoreductase, putative [Plasmodium yoelii]|eukprot:XP_731423.2 type II NADH:ubiquinone oxidoreductase, putative [Plasmodium yoelii]